MYLLGNIDEEDRETGPLLLTDSFYHNRRKTPSFSSGDTALALDSYAVLETWRAPCGHKAEGSLLKIQLLQMAYHI